jgi:hypothetical protein
VLQNPYRFPDSLASTSAVPELSAAFWDEYVPWPTISGTVGYLEYWHPLGLPHRRWRIAWLALHVVEFGPEKTPVLGVDLQQVPEKRYVNTPGGWSMRAERLGREINGFVYMAIAIIAPGLFVGLVFRPDDEYFLGEVL